MANTRAMRGSSYRVVGLLVAAVLLTSAAPAVSSYAAPAVSSSAATAPGSTYDYGEVIDANGNASSVLTPTKLPALIGQSVVQVSTGSYVTLALTSAGQVYSWGYNDHGQLGNGTFTDNFMPTPITFPASASKIVKVQITPLSSNAMALTSTGQVLTWGEQYSLGDGSTVDRSVPAVIALPGNRRAVDISADDGGAAVVTRDGRVFGWGSNQSGQLGNGHTSNKNVPRPLGALLPAGFKATAVAAGFLHVLVLGSVNGVIEVLGYGDNHFGELGNGTSSASPQLTPVVVRFPAGAGTIASIYASYFGSAALTATGVFYRWGRGGDGSNGNGLSSDVLVPSTPSLPAGTVVTAVSMRDYNTEVLTSVNTVYGWGDNELYALGPGPATTETTPTQIPMPAGTIAGIGNDDLTSYVWMRSS